MTRTPQAPYTHTNRCPHDWPTAVTITQGGWVHEVAPDCAICDGRPAWLPYRTRANPTPKPPGLTPSDWLAQVSMIVDTDLRDRRPYEQIHPGAVVLVWDSPGAPVVMVVVALNPRWLKTDDAMEVALRYLTAKGWAGAQGGFPEPSVVAHVRRGAA